MAGIGAGAWVRTEPPVAVVRLRPDGDGYVAEIDRPSRRQFRQPIPVVTGPPAPASDLARAAEHVEEYVEVIEGRPAIVDGTGARRPLSRVVPPDGAAFAEWCGWYEDGAGDRDRIVLLSQIPEDYFGEPMCLIQDGDEVTRAYPLSAHHLVRVDGEQVHLRPAGPTGRPALQLGDRVLTRTERYRERPVSFTVRGEALSGTLIVPPGAGPHPAAVVVHGAAGGQRDACRLFADALLDAGLAVLIYDKRGHGQSQGQGGPETTVFDQADAVSAALGLLAGLPDVDAGRIGLLGFSNGMWAAPIAAARHPDLAFLAGVGSPGVTMAEAEVHRRIKVLREAGLSSETLGMVAATWRALFAIAAVGASTETSAAHVAELLAELAHADDLRSYQLPAYVQQNPMLSPIPPQLPLADLLALLTGEPQPELAHDPADDYARLHCPIFLQYGAEDTSIPVTASVQRIAEAIPAALGPRSAIVVYPHLEHQLTVPPDAVSGMSPEEAGYLFHDFRYGPRVKTDLMTWLRTVLSDA